MQALVYIYRQPARVCRAVVFIPSRTSLILDGQGQVSEIRAVGVACRARQTQVRGHARGACLDITGFVARASRDGSITLACGD